MYSFRGCSVDTREFFEHYRLDNMEWQTVGHELIQNALGKQIRAHAVAQAYLFVGPSGVGKRTLAKEFTDKLAQAAGHGSQLIEFSFSQSTIEQVRELIYRLSLRPQFGGRQVAILDAAEEMSVSAANALLKTIEEPTVSTVVIFVSSRNSVLATMRSRCQVFQFGRLSPEQMQAWARSGGVSDWSEEALAAADGSPGQFLLHQSALYVTSEGAWSPDVEGLTAFLRAPLAERLSFVGRWADDDTEVLRRRIAAWLDVLYKQPAVCTDLKKALVVLLEAWRRLQTNANKKLVLQYVCINIV